MLAALASGNSNSNNRRLIPYLPALIVQGHDWHFVATTYRKGRTTLWVKQTIGSTDKIVGIFKILCAIRRLTKWIDDEYWPLFRGAVLGLERETHHAAAHKEQGQGQDEDEGRMGRGRCEESNVPR